MALAPGASASADNGDTHIDAPQLQLFVMGLFFIFGGITSLNDVIIPKLKELFTLNYTQAMLVQFCFFAAYAVIGIPGARLVKKIGYMVCCSFQRARPRPMACSCWHCLCWQAVWSLSKWFPTP